LAARRQAKPTGVIETLSAGYAALNRHLWVLLLPIVVDLVLWLGPFVSFSPLVDPAVTRASELTRRAQGGSTRGQDVPEVGGSVEALRVWVIDRVGGTNALSLIARGPLAIPTLAVSQSSSRGLAFVSDWRTGLGVLTATAAGGLLLGGLFYRSLAAASSAARPNPLAMGRMTLRDVARVVGLIAALAGIGLLLGLPLLVLLGYTAVTASLTVAAGASVMIVAAVLFVGLHLFFAINAIFVSNIGPLAAIQHSVRLVRRYVWPTVALILLSWLILAGMTRVWDVVANTLQAPFGVVVSMLGNAYIASGLILASMIFYAERADASERAVPTPSISTP
jgi:hypothetical protein